MKRFIAIFMAMAALTLSSCTIKRIGNESESTSSEEKRTNPTVDYTPFDYEDLTQYVTIGNYTGIEYTYTKLEVTDEEVKTQTQNLLDYYKKYTFVEEAGRAAESSDQVNIDFTGYMNGETFSGGSATGTDVIIGSGSLIDGFEKGLIGLKAGDKKTLELTFPENYGSEQFNGKDVSFVVTVNKVSKKVYDKMTDELAQSLTSEKDVTAENFESKLRAQMLSQKHDDAESNKASDIWKAIKDNSTIKDYPERELASLKESILVSYEDQCEAYSMTIDDYCSYYGMTVDEFHADIEKSAKSYLEDELVAYAIARAENITISDADVQKWCEDNMSNYGYTDKDEFYKENMYYAISNTMLEKIKVLVEEKAICTNPQDEPTE